MSYQGKVFNVKDGNLGFGGEFNVPIYIAALGPQMLELAGELADGVLLNWAAPAYLERAMEHLNIGAARAGRDLEEIIVACYIRGGGDARQEYGAHPLEAADSPVLQHGLLQEFLRQNGVSG